MSHWLDTVITLIQADTADLRELARIAGCDVRTFYRGTKMDGADLRGQDLRGLNLNARQLANAKVDNKTLLEPINEWYDIESLPQLLKIVRARVQEGNFALAEFLLTENEHRWGEDEQFILTRAWIALSTGRFSDSAELYLTAMRHYPLSPSAYVGLGNAYHLMHNFEAAAKVFEDALRKFPVNITVLRAVAKFYIDSDNSPGLSYLSTHLIEHAKRKSGLTRDVARFLRKLGNDEQALQLLTHACKENPTPSLISQTGAFLRQLNYLDESERIYRRGLSMYPNHRELLAGFGRVAFRRGDYQVALEAFLAAQHLTPKDVGIWKAIAETYLMMGNFEEAEKALHTAATLYPDHKSPRRWLEQIRSKGKLD